MAVRVKLLQNNVKSSPNYGKYYAKAIPQGEVTLEQLMKEAQEHSSATEAQVKKVVLELKNLMKFHLAEGRTVDIEDIGRFHLAVESECVDNPKQFNIRHHIRRVVCKFLPSSHRRHDKTLQYDFCENIKVERHK